MGKGVKFVHIGFGDANIRLHGRCEGEEEISGPHIFGRGKQFVEHLPREEKHLNLMMAMRKATD